MDSKNLSLALIGADNTDKVVEILKNEGLWDSPKDWKPYGGEEGNYSVIGNQQACPENAFLENPINSTDAMFTRECKRLGIDPNDQNLTPRSMREASENFFGIQDGQITNLSHKERRSLAEDIGIMAKGVAGKNPTLSVFDRGEGQSPNKFEDTFLSLAKTNKIKQLFVQGKMNQGSTGCLRFCGEHHLKLILSRKDPKILASDESDEWGFTIVRKEYTKGNRSSIYTYLAPAGKILSFSGQTLSILPTKYPKSFGDDLEWGTFIQLYDYELAGYKTNICLDLADRLSALMPNPPYPYRFYERRKGYKAHTYERTMIGLTARLEEDRSKNVEPGFPVTGPMKVLGEKFCYKIYALNRSATKKRRYKKNEGVIFSYNGQSHGIELESFFTRKNVNMSYIKDSLLVLVDCSHLSAVGFEDMFMPSRDRMPNTELVRAVKSQLEGIISGHPALRKLREERKRQDVDAQLDNAKPLKEIYEKLIKQSPTLAKIMLKGFRLPNPFDVTGSTTKDFNGKKYPSYFRLIKRFESDNPRECEIGRKSQIQFESDVEHDYFDRNKNSGDINVYLDGKQHSNWGSINGYQGRWTLNLNLPSNSSVSSEHEIKVVVSDPVPIVPLEETFFIKIAPKVPTKNQPSTGKRKGSGKNKGKGDSKNPPNLKLPQIQEVSRDKWDNHDFNKESGFYIKEDGNGSHITFVNVDSVYLKQEQKAAINVDANLIKHQWMFGLTLHGWGLVMDYEKHRDSYEEDIEQLSRKASNWMSPIVLGAIRSLGSLDAV